MESLSTQAVERPWGVVGLVAVTLCGIVASITLGQMLADGNAERWSSNAREDAATITRSIDDSLGQIEAQLRALSLVFIASDSVSQEELSAAEALMSRSSLGVHLFALGYAQRITRSERAVTEARLRTPLTFPQQSRQPVGVAHEHFPVTLASAATPVLRLGSDIAAEPALRIAAATAIRRSGEPVMSPAFEAGGQQIVGFVLSVHNGRQDGLLIGLLRLAELFQQTTATAPAGLRPWIDQAETRWGADEEGRTPLLGRPGDSGDTTERFDFELTHGEAHWRVGWELSEAYGGGIDRRFAYAVAVGGSLLSLVVGLVILLLLRQNRAIRQRVHERTVELRQALIRAEAANEARTNFLAVVSHELRTPLNAIIGFAQLLRPSIQAGRLQPEAPEYLGYIHDSGQHLLREIDDLLDLAQANVQTLRLTETVVDPGAILDDMVRLMGPQAEGAGILVTVHQAPALPLMRADPRRIRQILMNLGMNALKSVSSSGRVTFSVDRSDSGGIVFSVADTGSGMSREAVALAMEPFGQTESAFSRRRGGLGIGLPLCSHLASLHGGALEIDSRVGEGTLVSLTLPAWRVLASGEASVGDRGIARPPADRASASPIPFPVRPRWR